MSTITDLNSNDSGTTVKNTVNTNFDNLNTDKAEGSDLTAHTGATTGVHGITGSVVGSTDTQTLTNKTLTTPSIASFTNAAHNHTNAAGGAQLTDAALSAAVTVSKGGTGQTSFTTNGVLLGSATAPLAITATGTTGQVLTSTGGATPPTFQTKAFTSLQAAAAATVDGAGHQVTKDSLLFGFFSQSGSGGNGQVYVDSNSTPTTQVAAFLDVGEGDTVGSFCVAVKANDYYKISVSSCACTAFTQALTT